MVTLSPKAARELQTTVRRLAGQEHHQTGQAPRRKQYLPTSGELLTTVISCSWTGAYPASYTNLDLGAVTYGNTEAEFGITIDTSADDITFDEDMGHVLFDFCFNPQTDSANPTNRNQTISCQATFQAGAIGDCHGTWLSEDRIALPSYPVTMSMHTVLDDVQTSDVLYIRTTYTGHTDLFEDGDGYIRLTRFS
jgi:hypothetical protein